jgi:predicted membrane channel-forming protein YqfA (hemolysin III family)
MKAGAKSLLSHRYLAHLLAFSGLHGIISQKIVVPFNFYSRLDYCGIAMLIMGSFVPWLYYGFYCQFQPKLIYLSVVICLGISAIIVSLWDRFSEPRYRPLRAGEDSIVAQYFH